MLVGILDADSHMNITFTAEQALAQHPQFHITPQSGWMNDPNGMFQLGALYHVFFQYNPAAGTLVTTVRYSLHMQHSGAAFVYIAYTGSTYNLNTAPHCLSATCRGGFRFVSFRSATAQL